MTTLDGAARELKAAAPEGLLHPPDRLRDRPRRPGDAGHGHHFAEIEGKPHRIVDGQVNLGLAVDVEKKDGSRTLMVPVIRDAGRLDFDGFLDAYDALVEKARTNTLTADDLVGANITLTNPGGHRHGRLGPAADDRPGDDRRHRLDRLPRRASAAVGASIGAEKVMTMTSTYDHRIIQGAESGRFLALIEEYLQGEHGFYEEVFASLGVELGPAPALRRPPRPRRRAAARAAAPAAGGEELLQAVQAASTFVGRVRSHGHLAAQLDPLGSEPEGDPGLDPEALGLTPELQATDPGEDLPDVRARRDARRRAAAPARDLLRHDRLRDRAHRLPPPARVAARAHRVGRLPPRAHRRRAARAAASAWSRSTRSSASCTRPTSASTSSRSRAWT